MQAASELLRRGDAAVADDADDAAAIALYSECIAACQSVGGAEARSVMSEALSRRASCAVRRAEKEKALQDLQAAVRADAANDAAGLKLG